MLLIDGQEKDLDISGFENLDQVFIKVMEDGDLNDRVVTDVFVNDKPFSEIYPHQAEDIDMSDVQRVEIRTLGVTEVAVEITRELYKVVTLMGEGATRVAEMFRQADDADALETYQDLLDVTRNFINMISILRSEFALKDHKEFLEASDQLSGLFSEMTEVLANEDWILLADLLEYEFLPAVNRWKKVVALLREDVRTAGKD
jgi:Predicted peptidyl-prolyl cis-trans isomerase (rotamase), cyclophilin family